MHVNLLMARLTIQKRQIYDLWNCNCPNSVTSFYDFCLLCEMFKALLSFVKKIFRKIYGPKYENGEWKSRTNRELEEMRKGENIVKWIKGQRISWLGHLERMEEDKMPKKIFTQELEESRRKGRPKKGWKEEVERDLRVLGVRRWRDLVADRKKWKDIVRQAKAHRGQSPQWAVVPIEE